MISLLQYVSVRNGGQALIRRVAATKSRCLEVKKYVYVDSTDWLRGCVSVNAFEIYDCQIDAKYHWRPEFVDNEPRVRIALFPERLTVTAFDDASEGITEGRTLYVGNPSSSWRAIVQSILDCGEYCTLNPDWPESASIVAPSQLRFTPQPNTALRLIALAWLGSEWTQAVEYLLRHSEEVIAAADGTAGLIDAIERASSETVSAFSTEPEDISPEKFFEALLEAVMTGKKLEELAQQLISENWG